MSYSSHLIAAVVVVLAMIVFQIVRAPLHFQFGFRTYWPAFLCAYIVIWYYLSRLRARNSN